MKVVNKNILAFNFEFLYFSSLLYSLDIKVFDLDNSEIFLFLKANLAFCVLIFVLDIFLVLIPIESLFFRPLYFFQCKIKSFCFIIGCFY